MNDLLILYVRNISYGGLGGGVVFFLFCSQSNTTTRKQTQTTQIGHEPSYKQPDVKTNRTSFLCFKTSKG